jgi:V/A-type H+-transporting ATPase subunit I
MAKVRVLGPRARLDDALRVLQDFGLLHLNDASAHAGLAPPALDVRSLRHTRHVSQAIDDISISLRLLGVSARSISVPPPAPGECARWARQARRALRQVQRIVEQETRANEERALIERYRDFLNAVLPIVKRISQAPRLTSYAVVVPASLRESVEGLSEALRQEIGPEFALTSRVLRGGDVAVLLVLPREFSDKLEARLAEAQVPEAPLPIEYSGMPLEQAIPKMIQRFDEIPRELAQCAKERRELTHRYGGELSRASSAMHDWLARVEARGHCGVTAHAFSVEGWLPASRLRDLSERLQTSVPDPVVVEQVEEEEWRAEDAPVVLSNPRLFRPFESIVGLLPLPRYGTIDPTPFVAVFFPMIFGMIMGDVGYGLALALLSVVVRARSRVGSIWRSASEIAVPCAAFAVIFGVLYGEFLGDLGRRLFGMRALAFDREESVTAALTFAIAIGGVHVLLGLVLGVISAARHEPRHALGRGVSALMVILIAVALLAAFDVLPSGLFSPAVVALLVAFPILVILEGFVAPIELLATLGNVLSYARIMALGTASVMLAVVANQMVGALGRTVVGVIFALLFHLVNFAIGMFSPTIHAMRLHFVEFFGKFYSPGGRRYEPFSHWRPSTGR